MRLGKIVRLINVDHNSVIFVKEGIFGPRDIDTLIEKLKEEVQRDDFCVVVVTDVNDIRCLTEDQMNEIGWYKGAQIAGFQGRIRQMQKDFVEKQKEEETDD